jgi:hypothetical protein
MDIMQFEIQVKTKPVVNFLSGCSDQVATTKQIADHFDAPMFAVENALRRLLKVGRVAEIHLGMWHLE